MSDDASISSHPGSLSPRNLDTVVYRVLKPLPKPVAAVGETFSSWPQGEVFAHVSSLGLGPVKNGEIHEWEAAGLIVREKPLTPAQERILYAERQALAQEAASHAQE